MGGRTGAILEQMDAMGFHKRAQGEGQPTRVSMTSEFIVPNAQWEQLGIKCAVYAHFCTSLQNAPPTQSDPLKLSHVSTQGAV